MVDSVLDVSQRRVINFRESEFLPYDRYNKGANGLQWLPLTKRQGSGFESYVIRFAAGVASTPHEHVGGEEFLVLEGELEDSDGTLFKAGDYVSYAPGSRHFSVSPAGCTLLVVLPGGANRAID